MSDGTTASAASAGLLAPPSGATASPSGTHSNSINSAPASPKEAGTQQVIGGQFFLGETLGKSLFGVVYRGLNSNTGEFVAIKQIPLDDLDPEKVANITKEIQVFKKVDHPNMVRVVDAIKQDRYLYLVLELVEGGSVVLMKESFVNLPESLIAKYVSKCLKGLRYLHENRFIHSDIKGVNVLITRDGQVKLADCVQPKLKSRKDAMTIGQPYWMAPEVIKNNNETAASDVWSLGCTVIELLSGHPPYAHLASMAAVIQIMKDEMPPIPEGTSAEVKDFLRACLQKDPARRATVDQLLAMPWITAAIAQEEASGATAEPESRSILDISPSEATLVGVPPPGGSSSLLSLSSSSRPVAEGSEEELRRGDEEHLTLRVHLNDLPEAASAAAAASVMLFVFQDTHAIAMVDVALKQAGIEADPNQFCLVESDNVTLEERRFDDYDFPKLEAEVLWQFESEIRFSIRRKARPVREGWLDLVQRKRVQRYYVALDMVERYVACYAEKPRSRDEDRAVYALHGLHLVQWVYISDDVENAFVIRLVSGREDVFQTASYDEMVAWVNDLRDACDIHFLFDEED